MPITAVLLCVFQVWCVSVSYKLTPWFSETYLTDDDEINIQTCSLEFLKKGTQNPMENNTNNTIPESTHFCQGFWWKTVLKWTFPEFRVISVCLSVRFTTKPRAQPLHHRFLTSVEHRRVTLDLQQLQYLLFNINVIWGESPSQQCYVTVMLKRL